MRRLCALTFMVAALAAALPAQERRPILLSLDATSASLSAIRRSDAEVLTLTREGRLVETAAADDPFLPGIRHRRLQQRHRGVPVWGTSLTVQQRSGVPLSVYGAVYEGLDAVSTVPTLSADVARAIVARRADVALGPFVAADLFVRPSEDGARLVYAIRAMLPNFVRQLYFVDAHTGAIVAERRDSRTVAAVGTGLGVLRDRKKVSASLMGSLFVAIDELRPTPIRTYDFRGDSDAVTAVLNGQRPLLTSDLASDTDNDWTDPAVVDAHVLSGLTYDYLFKRFGRHGLDDRGMPLLNIVHPVYRDNIGAFLNTVGSVNDAPLEVPDFFVNAGYLGSGISIYGDGLPPGFVLVTPNGDQAVDYLSGALDIVGHEIAHGVLEFTSNLEFIGESGALNEAFCDIVGTSVEFYYHQPGSGRGRADYLIAEDILSPGAARSFSSPKALSQPDHYAERFTGTEDNGGVHINSGIVNHAFFLAIEGGRNSVSGMVVTGVGADHRHEVERAFFRAFTLLLPANATFATARAATIQSAAELYGGGSGVVAAIAAGWTAVGVQ